MEQESLIMCENISKQFSNFFPAVQIPNKTYSLEADMFTGWRPKQKILGPIPINFDSLFLDQIVDELTSFGSKHKERVIYLGHRFSNSFKMHQEIKRNYHFKYENVVNSNCSNMAAYFRKFHNNFKAKTSRIFKGMNPTVNLEKELVFDSNFQSGNLDAAIKVADNQYDLFIRIDTNTRGHLQWFNFTVKNCGRRKVKFNIVNFTKGKTLYLRGMKPYVYSQYLKQSKQLDWFQGGSQVKYSRRKLMYDFMSQKYEDQRMTYNCLQFQYHFEVDWQIVQFAYSPPFTYTDTVSMIQNLKKTSKAFLQKDQLPFIKEEILCQSLSGIDIPLLTITDPEIDNKNKKCMLVSARIHPGQTCSSFMVKGLLKYICDDSLQAKQLRKNVVFKVIPMLNPDGVIAGNYRTSFCGRDLNRTFKMSNDYLIPQVKALKELVVRLKMEYKNRLILFLDLHGHSVKKNVFLYGPQYQIWQNNYYKTRIFPKIMSNKTDMFRYYSCIFRIAEFKKTTARAVLLRNIPHCYTIQASAGFYYCPNQKMDLPFTCQKWQQMGQKTGQSISQYMQILNEQDSMKQQRRQKMVSMKMVKNLRATTKRMSLKSSSNKFQTRVIPKLSSKESKMKNELEIQIPMNNNNFNDFLNLSKKTYDIIQSIKQEQQKIMEKKQTKHDQGHESDDFSQGGSDSQSQNENIPEEELNHLHNDIVNYMQQFRQKIYKEKEKINRNENHVRTAGEKKKSRNFQEIKSKRESKGIQLIASLRKKAEQIQNARQVISWNKVKQQLKHTRTNNAGNYSIGRSTLGNIEGLFEYDQKRTKMHITGLQKQILQRQKSALLFHMTSKLSK